MWFVLLLLVAVAASVLCWRAAVRSWDVSSPRQAVEMAWYRLNPPRSVSVQALQQRVLRAAVNARVVSVRGVCLVPSTFQVALHPDDLAAIEGVRDWIGSELSTALTERAQQEGWQLRGRPLITFVADPARVPGHPDVLARHETVTMAAVPDPTPDREDSTMRPGGAVGWLRPLGDDDPIALTHHRPVVLGRGSTADADLGDQAVSRRHCELRPTAAGWTLTDLGSANGTTVNDRRLTGPRVLRPGDTVVIGGAVRFVAEGVDDATHRAPELADPGLGLESWARTEIAPVSGRR